MGNNPFNFGLGETVKLIETTEEGKVIGRADYQYADNAYLVRYRAGDGRQVEVWWTESAIEKV